MKELRIGLLGLGQVGSGVYSLLRSKSGFLAEKADVRFTLEQIAVKHRSKKRLVKPKGVRLTTNAWEVVKNPSIDVVVELIGGIHPAKELILYALRSGKDVVTANKALLAEHGREIFREAKRLGRHVGFEASVGGGIPVIKTIREGLVSNRIKSIHSIINGTCNYILTKMSEEQLDFAEALKLAQAKGYAEADPRLDIEGIDAAHKITILAGLVFGGWTNFRDVRADGISKIRGEDISFAKEFGYTIKLLAIAKKTASGIETYVEPTLLPNTHVLSSVRGSFNAVFMHGDEVGDILLYGRGAGSRPTASAVVSDLVDIAKLGSGKLTGAYWPLVNPLRVNGISSLPSRYYLRFHVVDRPGVLAQISHVLGAHKISISNVIQKEWNMGSVVPLILLTHEASEHSIRRAVRAIDRLRVLKGKTQVLRIEE